jgi:hypothetical protein
MRTPIRVDRSTTGVVITCSRCGHWAAFRFAIEEAWTCAEDHEARVHPDLHHHRDARLSRAAKAAKRLEKARHAV